MRTWIDGQMGSDRAVFHCCSHETDRMPADLKAMEGSTRLLLVAGAGVRRVARVALVSPARPRHRAEERKLSA